MVIIPAQSVSVGKTVEFEAKTYVAEKHVSQGKDLKDSDYTHIMFDAKGCFAMREV